VIRALVVDDEPPARDLLRSLLGRLPDITVVGEAGDGREAVSAIETLRPDLVFLDVQMPELDGFSVIEEIGPDRMPAVVFVTAYDRYALRAFEVHALDFLLKPYDQKRLAAAVRHATERGVMTAQLKALLRELRTAGGSRLSIKSDGRVRFLDTEAIDWIEADDKVVRIHAGKEVHLMRTTLSSVGRQLDTATFVRIHRSTIVNAKRIREIQPWFHNDYVVIMADGTKLMTGRAYRTALKHLIGDVPG